MKNNNDNKYLFPVFLPNVQISFFQRLQSFRHSHLSEALGNTVEKLKISILDHELAKYVSEKALSHTASYGLRGEIIFPVPYILKARPTLLGYYRLLFGLSQKEFYRDSHMSPFKRLEERNELSNTTDNNLPNLCKSLVKTAEIMLEGIDKIDERTVRDLQLLTLGAQLRGGRKTKVGKDAAAEVFGIIEKLLHANLVEESVRKLVVENAAGRRVDITFSSDPDIAIMETMPSGPRFLVSIEIKGGVDVSNIHNRIGEAEKSHQKAKSRGFHEFWTIIGTDVDKQMAKRESPTSSRFFHLTKLRNIKTSQYKEFRDHLQALVGISS
jgi:hypothetical protein